MRGLTPLTTTLTKALAAASIVALTSPVLAAPAHADDTSTPLSAVDLTSAVAAARSSQGLRLVTRAAHASAQRQGAANARAAAPGVATSGVAVYGLTPEFVSGRTRVPGQLWYVATDAVVNREHHTIYTAPDARGAWQPVNVASGDTETRMAELANGAPLLAEPQVGAWYAVRGDQVRPLNAAARTVVGAKAVTVAAYQRIVAARYGDKLPGSRYDDQGTAGGYAAARPTAATDAADRGDDGAGLLLPATGLAGAAGLLLLRRRRAR